MVEFRIFILVRTSTLLEFVTGKLEYVTYN